MAYWTRKYGSHVYVYIHENGKNKPPPRAKTKHLDGATDDSIDAWVRNWEKVNGYEDLPRPTLTHPETLELVEEFLTYLATTKKSHNTRTWYRQVLLDYVLPYFVHTDPILRDPIQWPSKSIRMLTHLQKEGASEWTIQRSNIAIKAFWNWLQEEGLVPNESVLRTRNPIIGSKETPLKRALTPDEVLRFCRNGSNPELTLMAAIGYFFSLRPQEIFALCKADFLAGTAATKLEDCNVMQRLGLYNKFAVHITKQRTQNGNITVPKAHSIGWVACFNEEAARYIVMRLQHYKDSLTPLFGRLVNDTWFEKWSIEGIEDVTLKDLRRASTYWLGHYTDFETKTLKSHARHARESTTEKYLRRPGERKPDEVVDLDLDK